MISIHGPVLLDLNTQKDLLTADGAYPLHQWHGVVDPLKKLFTWAGRLRVPVVSTRLRHLVAPSPRGPGKMVGDPRTAGFEKIPQTTLRRRQEMPLDCGTSLPVEGFKVYQQWIFDLPGLNLFECPRLDRLLSEGHADLWIICGGPLEWTVRTAVLGLLQRRQKVAVVSDAVGKWDPYEGDMAFRQIESKNITWFSAAGVLEKFAKPLPVKRPGIPGVVLPPRKPRAVEAESGKGAEKKPAASPRGKAGKREYRLT